MVTHNEAIPTYFPRQVGDSLLDFDDWARRVRQQMLTCLQTRGRRQDPKAP